MEKINDFTSIEQILIRNAIQSVSPINGSLELLPLCNMNCDMCYIRLNQDEMLSQGKLRPVEEWLNIARQMKDNGVLFLLLTGGEPLIYPNFKQLYVELNRMGIVLTLNTNGTLIDEEWAAFFGKYKPRRINITLYGATDETYQNLCHFKQGFKKTLRGIHLLRQYGVDVKLSGTMTKSNSKDLAEIYRISNELHIPVNIDTYLIPNTRERKKNFNHQIRLSPKEAAELTIQSAKLQWTSEQFGQYVKRKLHEIESPTFPEVYSGLSCLAGNCSFAINWQGKMRPCVMLPKPEADVFKMGFQSSWEYISKESKKIVTSPKCCACNKRTICRTCAAAEIFEKGQHGIAPEYLCEYSDELLKLLKATNKQ